MFKFSAFNEYSIENLEKNQIWCNHYSAFNDPFECWSIEHTGIPDPYKEKNRYQSVVEAWGYDPGPDNYDEFREYCSEFDNEYAMRVSYFTDSARISCFCKEINNLLMWSHYADGLRGFCIGFNKNLIVHSSSSADVFNVIYGKQPVVIDSMVYEVVKDQIWYHEMAIEEELSSRKYLKNYKPDISLPEYKKALKQSRQLHFQMYFKMLCHKPIEWRYEKEIRLIYHSESENLEGEPYQYPASAIKSIYIGEKATDKNVDKLLSVLEKQKLDVPIYMARRNRENYEILLEPLNQMTK